MKIPIENGNQIGILITSSFSIMVAAIAVALRIIAKCVGFGFDRSDLCILTALFFNTALHTCCILLVTHGGFGFHTVEIYERFDIDTATFFFKGIMTFAILWNATVCFSKLSVLLMYTALMPVPSMIRSVRIIGGLIVCWNVSDILAGLLICRPLARNWDFTLKGICGSQPRFYFAMGIINLAADAIMIALPIPYLLHLKLATQKKLLAIAIFSIGLGTWVITIYRQTLLPGLDFMDMTYTGVLATMLSGLEPSVAIVLACIPLMRPLFRRAELGGCHSAHVCEGNKLSSLYSARKGRDAGMHQGSFNGAEDYADDASELHLQPMKPAHRVSASTEPTYFGSTENLPGQALTI